MTYKPVYSLNAKIWEESRWDLPRIERRDDFHRERSVIVCFTCNQPGHYSTNCPTGSRNKLLESELRDLKEKEEQRKRKKAEKEKAKEETAKFLALEERLQKSVNQTLQPILEVLYSPEKAQKKINKLEEEDDNHQKGQQANGELLTVMKALTEHLNRLGALPTNNPGTSMANSSLPTSTSSNSTSANPRKPSKLASYRIDFSKSHNKHMDSDIDSGEETEPMEQVSKKRKAQDNVDKPKKKKKNVVDELTSKMATFEKLIGKTSGWKMKAREMASIFNVEIDFNTQTREDVIRLLANASIK